MLRDLSKRQGEWQKIAIDGDSSLRGQNKLNDVTYSPREKS